MIISTKHRYVFASVPKTGTHTMYAILSKHYNGERIGGFHHGTVPDKYAGYFKFCTVRNPYSKFASIWYILNHGNLHNEQITKMIQKPLEIMTLAEWMIKERGNLLPFTLTGLKLGSVMCPTSLYIKQKFNFTPDKFLKIEELETELSTLPFSDKSIKNQIEFSQRNNKGYLPWEELKTPELTELVNLWAGDDFKLFNYIRE